MNNNNAMISKIEYSNLKRKRSQISSDIALTEATLFKLEKDKDNIDDEIKRKQMYYLSFSMFV